MIEFFSESRNSNGRSRVITNVPFLSLVQGYQYYPRFFLYNFVFFMVCDILLSVTQVILHITWGCWLISTSGQIYHRRYEAGCRSYHVYYFTLRIWHFARDNDYYNMPYCSEYYIYMLSLRIPSTVLHTEGYIVAIR